jgi:hypothetical protein
MVSAPLLACVGMCLCTDVRVCAAPRLQQDGGCGDHCVRCVGRHVEGAWGRRGGKGLSRTRQNQSGRRSTVEGSSLLDVEGEVLSQTKAGSKHMRDTAEKDPATARVSGGAEWGSRMRWQASADGYERQPPLTALGPDPC